MKILYIDPIDKGYRNFLRLNEDFVSKGFETLLLHTTSLFEDDFKREEKIGNMILRDISYYQTKCLRKVIEQEKPKIIVMINLSFTFDRTIVNIAKKNSIKICYLAHGTLVNPNTYLSNVKELDKNIKKNPARIFSKKNYTLLMNYLDSQYKRSKFLAFYRLIRGIVKSPSQFLTFAKYEDELDVDLLLVYINDDRKHLIENMNYPAEKIKVVGNPEISQFMKQKLLTKSDFQRSIGLNENDDYVVYLDDGFVDGETIWTEKQWFNHLDYISDALEAQNKKLVLKLHPRIKQENYKDFFNAKKNILPIEDTSFNNLLYHSDFSISHYSSTIIYAFLFEKNVISPRWDDSSNFDKKYSSDVVYYCSKKDEFEKIIKNGFKVDKTHEIKKYLSENGINTQTDSVKLIVNEILKLHNT